MYKMDLLPGSRLSGIFVFSPSPTARPVHPATSFLNGLTVPVCLPAPASSSLKWAAHEGHLQWMNWQLELQLEVTRGGHIERRTSFVGKKSTTPRRRRIKMELSTATYCEALPIFSLLYTLFLLPSFVRSRGLSQGLLTCRSAGLLTDCGRMLPSEGSHLLTKMLPETTVYRPV